MPILMSRDNPTGAKLEDLLDQVAAELTAKNALIEERLRNDLTLTNGSVSKQVFERAWNNNRKVIEHLYEAQRIQIDTMQSFTQLGPDKGPTAPRI